MNPYVSSIALLGASSVFMTIAWYAHLKFKHLPIWQMILFSWLIAFLEYCLQVPGNRIGHSVMSAAKLRIIAEFFTLAAFVVFSIVYLKEPMSINYLISFALVLLAVYFAVLGPFP